mmetsp:Transcript_17843/g.42056  ORF Transcript_17843/g.42056 Transcript_17843/m.42056 type:complete len:439 (+) Transcript_17843:109-1425(+)
MMLFPCCSSRDHTQLQEEAKTGTVSAAPVKQWTVGWLPDEVGKFWQDNRTNFIEFWKKVRPQERVAILRKINPNMPTRPGDDFINGQYVGVASRLCPELSIDTLVKNQGVGLIELFDERTKRVEEAQKADIQLVSKLVVDGIVEGVSIDKLATERETRILQHLHLISHVFNARFQRGEGSFWADVKPKEPLAGKAANRDVTAPPQMPGAQTPLQGTANPTDKPWSASEDPAFRNQKPWSAANDPAFSKPPPRAAGQAVEIEAAPRDAVMGETNLTGKEWTQHVNPADVPQHDAMRNNHLSELQMILDRMSHNNGYMEQQALLAQQQQMTPGGMSFQGMPMFDTLGGSGMESFGTMGSTIPGQGMHGGMMQSISFDQSQNQQYQLQQLMLQQQMAQQQAAMSAAMAGGGGSNPFVSYGQQNDGNMQDEAMSLLAGLKSR